MPAPLKREVAGGLRGQEDRPNAPEDFRLTQCDLSLVTESRHAASGHRQGPQAAGKAGMWPRVRAGRWPARPWRSAQTLGLQNFL